METARNILLVSCALLGLNLGYQHFFANMFWPTKDHLLEKKESPTYAKLDIVTARTSDREIIWQKSLFSPARSWMPVQVKTVTSQRPTPKLNLESQLTQYTLVGIIGEADTKSALVAQKNSRETLIVKQGDQLGELTILALGETSITVTLAGKQGELSFPAPKLVNNGTTQPSAPGGQPNMLNQNPGADQ